MADFALAQASTVNNIGLTSTNLTELNNPGSAHTKGSWVELISATSFDVGGIWIYASAFASDDESALAIDIALGAAGSEVIIVPNYPASHEDLTMNYIYIPIFIPKGNRISARQQSNSVSDTAGVSVQIHDTLFSSSPTLSVVDEYGYIPSTSYGTTVTLGVSGSKGTWVEFSSSSEEIKQLIFTFIGENFASGAPDADYKIAIDIALGAAGSEVIIISDVCSKATTAAWWSPSSFCFPVQIPQGSRVAIRGAQAGTTGDELIQLVMHGVR